MATLAIVWNGKTGQVTISCAGRPEIYVDNVTDIGIEETNTGAQTNFNVLPPVKVQEVL